MEGNASTAGKSKETTQPDTLKDIVSFFSLASIYWAALVSLFAIVRVFQPWVWNDLTLVVLIFLSLLGAGLTHGEVFEEEDMVDNQ